MLDFYLGAFEEPAGAEARWRRCAWKTHQCHSGLFSSLSSFPWSGALSDNWQAAGRLLVVILVGTGFRRAPSALWVFAFVSAMPRARLALVPVSG